jgi:hypothetical protein
MPTRKVAQTNNARAQEAGPSRPVGAWIEPYLEALAGCGLKMVAYKAVGVTASTVMRRRGKDVGFAKREELAFRSALINVVEPAIMKRAIRGVKKIRYGRDGKILSIEHECSDQLALRLAERLETGTWRQKPQIEHSRAVGFRTRADRIKALAEARITVGRNSETARPISEHPN